MSESLTVEEQDELASLEETIGNGLADLRRLAAVKFAGEVHPLAAVWPLLAEEDLRALADDIAEHGLTHPVVLDQQGRLVDGRNRLAACEVAGVKPAFRVVELDGDATVAAYIAGANAERRHLSTGQLAAGRALMLAAQGKRRSGRWAYGSVNDEDSHRSDGARRAIAVAGVVLDWCPDLLPRVLAGGMALDAAYQQARHDQDVALADQRAEQQRLARLRDLRESRPDLAELVDEGRLPLEDALTVRDRDLAQARKAEQVRLEGIKKLNWALADAVAEARHVGHPNNVREVLQAWSCTDLRPPLSEDLSPATVREAAERLLHLADLMERAE